MAAGIGLQVVSGRVANDVSQPIQALGVLGIALGLGFVSSAVVSFRDLAETGVDRTAAPDARLRAACRRSNRGAGNDGPLCFVRTR